MKVYNKFILFVFFLTGSVFAVPSTGRRHPPGRREKKETRRTPSSRGVDSRGPSDIWSEYMEKFDIARVHGSGVYVDLGATVQMGNYSYRMPNGKCPVAGKVIQLESGADFLNPISANEARDCGLGFPETKATSRGNRQTKVSKLSPVSASALRNMDYRNDTDLANCAEYAKNIVPASDRSSKYRYPFVYDSYNKMCHILYSPMQYNQGAKYCDNNSMDEGLSSLICMYPQKLKTDAHLYYGSANVAMDWDLVCPMHPIKDAMFGKWNGEFCELIHPHHEESASSPEECSEILFEYSPSDIDVDAEVSNVSEVDQFWKELRKQKFADAFTRIFSFASPTSASVKTGGVGINWANFNPDTQTCNIFDVQPTCLVLNAGHYALTSLSSPSISGAVPYPCSIKSRGYIDLKDSTSRKPNGDGFVPYTANDKKTLKCDKYVHSRYSESCGYYYECSGEPVSEWFYYYILISILLLVAFGIFVLFRRWWKNRRGTDYDDDYYCNNFYDKDSREQKWRRDEQLNSGAYVWGNGDSRPSDVTPVRLYKNE